MIYLSSQSFKYKIIDKTTYNEHQSIAFFEIAKIKHHSSEREATELIDEKRAKGPIKKRRKKR